MGKVSHEILQRVNSTIRSSTNLQQWQSTPEVLRWFNDIPNKARCSFLIFDIVDYYPSITAELLQQAISWAKSMTNITEIEERVIWHARKSLLYSPDGNPWMKRNTADGFDVTMGSNDGAEICELVGLFILHKLSSDTTTLHANFGLYRDDGLMTLENTNGSEADRVRKRLIALFHSFGLKITVATNP